MRMRSCNVFAAEGCGTTMTFVTHASNETPLKSRTASYGRLVYVLTLIVKGPLGTIMIV